MYRRLGWHILFWLVYIGFFVTIRMMFVSSSDASFSFAQKLVRYLITELAFLPWKALPFYMLFYYLIPRFLPKGNYVKLTLAFLLVLFVCLIGYRSTIEPIQWMLYKDRPDFNVYSLSRILYSISELLPALGLASSVKLLKGSILAKRREQALMHEKSIAELNFLKAQMNPHFLFNTLNNLYGLARRSDANTAPSILKLSNIMRYVLYECNESRILLKKEIDILDNFIELEKLRYGDRLDVDFRMDIDDWKTEIAPLIMLPFVENAFKHGASENRMKTIISIQLSVNDGVLFFSVENTVEEDTTNSDGIGLKNVRRQLDLIYGNDYDLKLEPGNGKYRASLTIKLL